MRVLAVLFALTLTSCGRTAPDEAPATAAISAANSPKAETREGSEAVGGIFIIKAEHAAEADKLFRKAGFVPALVQNRPDGNVEFVFGSEVSERLLDVTLAAPPHFYADTAKVGVDP